MKIIAIILALLIGSLIWINMGGPAEPFTDYTLPAKNLKQFMQRKTSLNDHPCLNRSRCLVLYLAPWCSSCKNTKKFVPYVHEALINNEDTGFVVVVGKAWGNFKGGYNMARDIDGPIYIDANADYWKELNAEVNAIPAWLVFTSDGKVSNTDTGSPRQHSITAANQFLNNLSIN